MSNAILKEDLVFDLIGSFYCDYAFNFLIDRDNLSKGVCINQVGTCPKSLDSFMLTQKRQTFRSSNLGSYGG